MKAIKRTVAALLATLMLATSTSFTLAAENYSAEEAVVVAKVNAAGIMTGTDKGFEPSKSLTRAEAAAIIVRMKGIAESAVKATAGTTLFNDVAASHWASGYVNQASNLGIVKGVSATEFAPDREVTIAEFTTMAIRALGAGQLVDSEGTWPTNYVNFANENGILDDVNAIYTATATRLQAATIVANTLEADMWEKSAVKSNGEITWAAKEGKTIVEDVLKINAFKNTRKETNEIKVSAVSNTEKTVTGENGPVDCVDSLDLSNIRVGMTYEVWYNKDDEIIGLWIAKDNSKVEFTQIVDYKNDEITLKVDGKDKKYDLAYAEINETDGVDVVYNESTSGAKAQVKKNKNANGVAYIDGGDITALYITEFVKYGVIDEVTATKVKFNTADIDGEDCSNFNINNEDNEYFLTKDGSAMKFTDLEEGDAIKYYTVTNGSSTKYVAEVITNFAEGEVTAKGTDYIKLDGKKYDLNTASNISWFNLEDEVKVWMNAAGKIIMKEDVEEAAGDVAIIKYFREVTTRTANSFDVQLAYMDGTVSEVLELDLDETKDNFEDAKANSTVTVTASTDGTHTLVVDSSDNAFDATYVLGDLVCYAISGDKVSFKPYTHGTNKAEYKKLTVDANDQTKELTAGSKYVYITESDSTVWYLTDSTKVFNIKAVSGSANAYDSKIEEVSVSDLDNMDVVGAYVADIDYDTNEVKAVVFNKATNVARVADANFAFITAVADCKYDNKNALTVDVIYADGSKAEGLIAQTGETTGYANIAIGNFVDLEVKDDMIVDADLLTVDPKDKLTDSGVVNEVITKAVTSNRVKVASTGITVVPKGTELVDNDSIDGTTQADVTSIAGITDANDKTLVVLYSTGAHTFFTSYDAVIDAATLTATELKVSDDVLVILKDGAKYTVKTLSDIEEYDDALDKNCVIVDYVTYTDDDDTDVVLFVYEEIED